VLDPLGMKIKVSYSNIHALNNNKSARRQGDENDGHMCDKNNP
jgi:hypothetical protein